MPVTLTDLFEELKAYPSGHAFTVAPVSGQSGAYLGIDGHCRPCLFAIASERCGEPPLRTAQVSLRLDQEYTAATVHGPLVSQRFHSLCCEATAASDIETFLVLAEAFLSHCRGRDLSATTLGSFFRSLVRLFAVAPSPDLGGERQGLWGELFMMRLARGFAFWAPFWHSDPTRLFDFSTQGRRVEVKTTLGGPRLHRFSHNQLHALPGQEVMIASLILREDDSGLTLRQLIDDCRAAVRATPHYLKLEKAVRQAGMADSTDSGPSFDPAEAEQQLAWFRSTEAPHFRLAEPPGVSDTHYRVDLSTAPSLQHEELEAWLDTWVETAVGGASVEAGS